ncbi:TorD/DmsD family molecular chaperone [Ottowia sp. SB7-C50]|uniref:TorD/DmsD family molecular chaperone n=1 Tax=Ottowia sp. SB7-C50 TaxID=3081231 RepID=UPI002955BDFE|nr:molecular chaperone TorD family protein [Ottowia sp. SB7-C50]WOP14865.1 molecular chaperone TorD family protein [Ottowia sp. SB7-C50]
MSELSLTDSGLDEETARAEVYGVLAQLFHAPPSPELLADLRLAVTEAPVPGGFLEEPWRQVVGQARECSDADIAAEWDALFGGVGKPDVLPYGSHYLSGFLHDKPLAQLRGDLAALGLGRDEASAETEDHIAYLCEVMRYLIAGDDVAVANLTQQQRFFAVHLQPWVQRLCDDIGAHPAARFYRAVAQFTHAFMGVEAQGFDLLE